MKKPKHRFKIKKTFYLVSIFIFLLFALVTFSLNNYLFTIQRTERLSKLENYENFTMTANFESRCQNHEIMTIDDKKIYYECIDQIYIHYGTISLFLQEALEKEYITIESILSHTIKMPSKKEESFSIYLYQNTRKNLCFEIFIDENSIVFRPVESS